MMNVPNEHALLSQPWVGASWEGYIIEQVIGELSGLDRLDKVADLIGAKRRFLVSRTRDSVGDLERASCDLAGMIDRIHHLT